MSDLHHITLRYATHSAQHVTLTVYVLTAGEDVAADALMRHLKERGVEVELRQDRKSTVGPGLLDILTGTYVRTYAYLSSQFILLIEHVYYGTLDSHV